jgi:hypothetical protein
MGPSGRCFVSNSLGYFLLEEPLFSLQQDSLANAFSRDADDHTIYDEKGFKWKTHGYRTPFQRRSLLLLPFRILFSDRLASSFIHSGDFPTVSNPGRCGRSR